MAEEPRLNDDLNSLAAALSSLTPRASRINRDQLMFEAGRAAGLAERSAVRTMIRFWQASTTVAAVAAACLVVLLVTRTQPGIQVAQPAPVNVQKPQDPPEESANPSVLIVQQATEHLPVQRDKVEMSYLKLREIALTDGLDQIPAVPASGHGSPEPATYRDLLRAYGG